MSFTPPNPLNLLVFHSLSLNIYPPYLGLPSHPNNIKMSYNDSYGGGENRGYDRPADQSEYGGGGRGSDNYYNQGGSGGEGRGGGGGGGGGGYNEGSYGGRGDNYNSGGGGEYSSGGGNYGGGSGSGNYNSGGSGENYGHDSEFSGALSHAQQHGSSSSSSEETSIFSSALSFLGGNKHELANQDIDEQQAVGAHQAIYGDGRGGGGGGGGQQHSSETMGAGAAMQALKMFTGGGAGHGGQGSQGGGNSQNQFIGMAMGQASKLFDQQSSQGNVVSQNPFFLFSFFFFILSPPPPPCPSPQNHVASFDFFRCEENAAWNLSFFSFLFLL